MTPYRAARLPKHQGPAAWGDILGPGPRFAPLEANTTADVVIIGAGFAGLSAALRLTQLDQNLTITVLEAGEIAGAASGRNSGFMIDLPHELTSSDYAGGNDGQQIKLNRHAIAFASDAVTQFQIPRAYFDPAGKVNGAVGCAALAHNQTYAQHLTALGEAHEMLDTKHMADLTGSAAYTGGLYTPGTIMLQPAGYIRALAIGLADQITIHDTSPVTALTRNQGWQVRTPKGTVSTPRVILATNGHLESFGFARGTLMHVFLYASMTPDLGARAPGAARWGCTPADPMGTTLRRIDSAQGGNRVITRTYATLRSGMETSPSDLARATALQRRKLAQHFPDLADVKPEYEWAGHLCLTRNTVSVTDALDDGLVAACVQNGLGTTRGTLTGIAAAERTLGQTSQVTKFFAAEPAAKPLPPPPFRDWGANALLRWKTHQARTE